MVLAAPAEWPIAKMKLRHGDLEQDQGTSHPGQVCSLR